MKLAEKPRLELLYKVDNLIIPFVKGQTAALMDFLASLDGLDLSKDYEVKIELVKKKRSGNANSYLWVLLKELARKLDKPYTELYKEFIREYGDYTMVLLRSEAVDEFMKNWKNRKSKNSKANEDGWWCDSVGEKNGYTTLKCYAGSSSYDTVRMSRLIDGVVAECKAQGIETMTPNELEKLKQQWGCG